jgi:hypothetical protein
MVLFALACMGGVFVGCPCLLNNRMAEQQLEGEVCLTLPAFSIPTVPIPPRNSKPLNPAFRG